MKCQLCAADLHQPGHVWIALNRFIVGLGQKARLIEMTGTKGYHWDADGGTSSGVPLCWPACASTWLEGEHVLHEVYRRRQQHG